MLNLNQMQIIDSGRKINIAATFQSGDSTIFIQI